MWGIEMTKHLQPTLDETMTIDEIAHKIAMTAIDEKDNVNLYTAVKTKTLELLQGLDEREHCPTCDGDHL